MRSTVLQRSASTGLADQAAGNRPARRYRRRASAARCRRPPARRRARWRSASARLQLAVLEPVQIAAGAAGTRHHAHGDAVLGLQRGAIHADVLDAGLGVLGDAQRGGQIGRGIEAGRRDGHRQKRHAAGLGERVAGQHDLLRGAAVDDHRAGSDWRSPSTQASPISRHGAAHAHRVDARARRQRAEQHRHVVAAALGVDDVGEQERLALVLGDAAEELQAHERLQLAVLVDRPVDRARDRRPRAGRGAPAGRPAGRRHAGEFGAACSFGMFGARARRASLGPCDFGCRAATLEAAGQASNPGQRSSFDGTISMARLASIA